MKTTKLIITLFFALSAGMASAQVSTVSLATTPIAVGQTSESLNISIQNASQCNASATLNTNLVALEGWNGTVCNSNISCSTLKNVTLNNLVAGTYAFSLSCVNAPSPVNITTNSLVITPTTPPNNITCPTYSPKYIETRYVDNQITGTTGDTNDFGSILGAISGKSDVAWPGVSNGPQSLVLSANQFLAIKFIPIGLHNGKYISQPSAGQLNASLTISTCKGDFRTTVVPNVLGANCSSNIIGRSVNSVIVWDTNVNSKSAGTCILTPGVTYYLNVVNSPLGNPPTRTATLCKTGTCLIGLKNDLTQ